MLISKLNTMFKQKSNSTFNNTAFKSQKIKDMNEMNPTAVRLYEAAREMRDVKGQSAVARLLNVSPQTMKNWEIRGVSESGALAAQKVIKCNANWLLEGEGPKYLQASKPFENVTELVAYEPKPPSIKYSKWPFESFNEDDWNAMDADSKVQIETYARGLVDRALLARRKAS